MSEDKKTMSYKKVAVIVAIVLVVCILTAIALAVAENNRKEAEKLNSYNEALEYISQGEYGKAYRILEEMKGYEDAMQLYYYSLARWAYEFPDHGDLSTERFYLGYVPENYDGAFADEVFRFIEEFESSYDEILAEQERQRSRYTAPSKPTPTPYRGSYYSSPKKDEYNARDYATEEDFYEDYYNDFADFDEAEQYWQEYG